jgi:hypothetical protein
MKLAEEAALFMFDQGFEVLTEQSLGQHRYDIVGSALVVEAKIYDEGSSSAVKVVTAGLKQVHQYTCTLRGEGVAVEPVLLLFRLGGGYLEPLPEYEIAGLTVSVTKVDLGLSESSGSRAMAPPPQVTQEDVDKAMAEELQAIAR